MARSGQLWIELPPWYCSTRVGVSLPEYLPAHP